MIEREKQSFQNFRVKQLYDRYKLLALSMFKWDNLPNGLKDRHIENALFSSGQCIFYEDKTRGLICLPCSEGTDYNIYGESQKVIATGYNFTKNVAIIDKVDSVINDVKNIDKGIRIFNNDLKLPSESYVLDYANRMYNVENSIELNIKQQKFPYFVVTNKNNEFTLKTMFKKIEEGEYAIFGSKNINLDDINVLNLSTPYVADKLNAYKFELEREILTFFGLNNNFEKKERLTSDEVNSNNDYIYRNVELMYKCRQQACELINEYFGLDIKVTKVDNLHYEIETDVTNFEE